jgi:hypothetical protein
VRSVELVVEVAGEGSFDAALGFFGGFPGGEQSLIVGGGLGVAVTVKQRAQ